MVVAISGATGLIGSALARSYEADGTQVIRLVRRAPTGPDELEWHPEHLWLDKAALNAAAPEVIFNMAGAGVGDKRWTGSYRATILDSRINGTTTLAKFAATADPAPTLVLGSAIGYYGDTGTEPAAETAPKGEGFLADVVAGLEAAAEPARSAGVRVVSARTGLVVSDQGGAWAKLVPIFKMGLGGRLGTGKQWWSPIALADEVRALRFVADTAEITGPVNIVGPHPVENEEATKLLAERLHRPAVLPVPGWAIKAAVGGFADESLRSQRIIPTVLTEHGFSWLYPEVADMFRTLK